MPAKMSAQTRTIKICAPHRPCRAFTAGIFFSTSAPSKDCTLSLVSDGAMCVQKDGSFIDPTFCDNANRGSPLPACPEQEHGGNQSPSRRFGGRKDLGCGQGTTDEGTDAKIPEPRAASPCQTRRKPTKGCKRARRGKFKRGDRGREPGRRSPGPERWDRDRIDAASSVAQRCHSRWFD
jgi:hypothetical protein